LGLPPPSAGFAFAKVDDDVAEDLALPNPTNWPPVSRAGSTAVDVEVKRIALLHANIEETSP